MNNSKKQLCKFKKLFSLSLLLTIPLFPGYNNNTFGLLNSINSQKDDTTKVRLYSELAIPYITSNPDSAIILLKKMVLLSEKLSFGKGLGRAYFLMGNSYYFKNSIDSSIICYQRSLTYYQNPEFKKEYFKSSINLGIQQLNKGNSKDAFQTLTQTLELTKELNDSLSMAEVNNYLCQLYIKTGNLNKALFHLKASKQIFETIKDTSSNYDTYSLFGRIYLNQDNPEKAIEMYQKALKYIPYNKDNLIFYANTHINIALAQAKLKHYKQALTLYKEAMEIYKNANDVQSYSTILMNIGDLFIETGDLDSALIYSTEALKNLKTVGNISNYALVNLNIGIIYYKKQQYQKSLSYYIKAHKDAVLCNNKELQQNTTLYLSEAYATIGDYKKAYQYHKLNKQISDSLFNESNVRALTTQEMNYEFDKKQKAAEFEQKQKELKLQTAIANRKMERNTIAFFATIAILGFAGAFLFFRIKQKQKINSLENDLHRYMQQALSQQMNPHFIFNCLSSIHSLTREDKHQEADRYFTDFAQLMRNNLEYTQKLAIPIEHELETLKLYVKLEQLRFKDKFSFIIDIDEDIDTYNLKIPALLLQPFVENSIIHGIKHKDDKGYISLQLALHDKEILCTIDDDGVGRVKSGEYRKNVKHQSMASSITKERLNLLSALFGKASSLNIIDKTDEKGNAKGTKIEFGIPIIT